MNFFFGCGEEMTRSVFDLRSVELGSTGAGVSAVFMPYSVRHAPGGNQTRAGYGTLRRRRRRLKGMTKKILVVDDDAEQRRVVHGILEPMGTILEASNGKDALRLVAAERPQLMLLDAAMSEM